MDFISYCLARFLQAGPFAIHPPFVQTTTSRAHARKSRNRAKPTHRPRDRPTHAHTGTDCAIDSTHGRDAAAAKQMRRATPPANSTAHPGSLRMQPPQGPLPSGRATSIRVLFSRRSPSSPPTSSRRAWRARGSRRRRPSRARRSCPPPCPSRPRRSRPRGPSAGRAAPWYPR